MPTYHFVFENLKLGLQLENLIIVSSRVIVEYLEVIERLLLDLAFALKLHFP